MNTKFAALSGFQALQPNIDYSIDRFASPGGTDKIEMSLDLEQTDLSDNSATLRNLTPFKHTTLSGPRQNATRNANVKLLDLKSDVSPFLLGQ